MYIYIFHSKTHDINIFYPTNLQKSDFEAIATVNVTTLLVLATLFISVSNALPRTSYVKLIDIWLIFNLVIPFVEIILQTSLCLLEEEDEEDSVTPVFMNGGKGKRTTEKYARGIRKDGWWKTKLRKMLQPATRYGLPGVYFAFIIIFFFIGIISDGTVDVKY